MEARMGRYNRRVGSGIGVVRPPENDTNLADWAAYNLAMAAEYAAAHPEQNQDLAALAATAGAAVLASPFYNGGVPPTSPVVAAAIPVTPVTQSSQTQGSQTSPPVGGTTTGNVTNTTQTASQPTVFGLFGDTSPVLFGMINEYTALGIAAVLVVGFMTMGSRR